MTGKSYSGGWTLSDRTTIAAAVLRTVLVMIITSWFVTDPTILIGVGAGAFVAPVLLGRPELRRSGGADTGGDNA